MTRVWERGTVLRQARCGLALGALCIAAVVLTPMSVAAQGSGGAAGQPSEETLNAAQKELDEARAKLDEAQSKLNELKPPGADLTAPPSADQREPTVEQRRGGAADPVGLGLVYKDKRAKKLQVSLNEDGSLYLRFIAWLQVWTRAMELNPGTTLFADPDVPGSGEQPAWYGDVAIRRARMLIFGEIFPRTMLMMHFGINNQTFRNARKPQLFWHDLWIEFDLWEDYIDIGAGLIYWNGISRLTNASTITLMTLDGPIVNWPTIDIQDQFARHLGWYAKGQVGGFDYRVAVVRPFATQRTLTPGGQGDFNTGANTWGYSGYFQYMFLDIEPNTLPYTVGTWIGTKRVLNIGAGFHAQPKGVAYITEAGEFRDRPLILTGVDFFADIPFKNSDNALTAYAVYYYYNIGPNNLRNIGIMNPGDPGSGTSLAGQGNAYPLLGTGHTGYWQVGWLLPWKAGGNDMRFQPYASSQMSAFEALNDPMIEVGVGVNMFIHFHNAKVTMEWRNRPIFDAATAEVSSRRGNSFILQMHLFI